MGWCYNRAMLHRSFRFLRFCIFTLGLWVCRRSLSFAEPNAEIPKNLSDQNTTLGPTPLQSATLRPKEEPKEKPLSRWALRFELQPGIALLIDRDIIDLTPSRPGEQTPNTSVYPFFSTMLGPSFYVRDTCVQSGSCNQISLHAKLGSGGRFLGPAFDIQVGIESIYFLESSQRVGLLAQLNAGYSYFYVPLSVAENVFHISLGIGAFINFYQKTWGCYLRPELHYILPATAFYIPVLTFSTGIQYRF